MSYKVKYFQLPICVLLVLHGTFRLTYTQRTSLDVAFNPFYRQFRLLGLGITGYSGNPKNVERVRQMGKTQESAIRTRFLLQFCDTEHGPGRRSATRPTSVHRLRPGDVDVITAIGDSLTAGNGIFASNLLHVSVENRGVSCSIGGQGDWQKYLTLPNILKEFNPNLYGYSLRDGLATDRSSRFNVAELGAMSRDVPYEAKILVKRLQRDPNVNMTEDWKLLTMLIGNNDFCSDICYYPNPEITIKMHEQNMISTFRYLRDNVPRLMINLIPAPNLRLLTRLSGLPAHCYTTLRFECPCLIGKSKSQLDYYENVMKKWIAKDFEIGERTEFNTKSFTINIQGLAQIEDFPRRSDGLTDTTFLSEDCFHLSQKGHAMCANALWNNMFEKQEEKSRLNPILFEKFLCPTEQMPYIVTRENSKENFKL